MTKKLVPIPPGEILLEEFMRPLKISQNKLASDLDVPVTRVNDIIHDRRAISADTALRLGKYFKNSAEFWLNLQSRYDLKIARRDIWLRIEKNIRPLQSGGRPSRLH
jgi:addiction module HigA family antidote